MLRRSLLPVALSEDPSNDREQSSSSRQTPSRAPVATRWSEADFEMRLSMLLAIDEGVRTLAIKLYKRFHGKFSELPVILQLLEQKWGFPDRLFPLLNTHLRRAVCRCRGTYGQVSEYDIPEYIEEKEWVEAFWKWLEAVHARCGQVKLTRKSMVRERSGITGIEASEEYLQGPQLGVGSFGAVHVVFHKALGVDRAVKVIDKALMSFSLERAVDEVNILKSLDHPHVVRIYETIDIDDKLHIVMDYAEGGNLAQVLTDVGDQGQTLTEDWSRVVAQQISAALEYMHSKGVIHCDLKPANAMLLKPVDLCTEEPHIVLVDFGISEIFEDRHLGGRMQVRGTLPYLSPDGFEGEYTDKSDMWALGVMIFEMLVGKRPFDAVKPVLLSIQVATREPSLDDLPLLVHEVMRGLLAKDPITRLSAKECRALEWFSIGCTQLPTTIQKKVKAVQSLGHINYFHQSAMFCVASGLSMKDMSDVFQAFQAIDTDRSGRLTLEQFTSGLELMGIDGDPEALMAILDVDRNGYISYTEFLAGTLSARDDVAESLVREAFSVFDLDGNGFISMHELRVMLSGDGPLIEVLPDGQTVDEVMEEVGNGQGVISLDDFLSYMRRALTATREPVSPLSPALLPSVRHLQAEKAIKKTLDRPSLGLEVLQLHPSKNSSMPPLHKWLSDVCGEDSECNAVNRFLNFPEQPLDPAFVAQHIGSIRKHFSAGISLAHSLVHSKGKDTKTLRKAVSAAAEIWGRASSGPQPSNLINVRGPLVAKESRKRKSTARECSNESDLPVPLTKHALKRSHNELEAAPSKLIRRTRGLPTTGSLPDLAGMQPPLLPQLRFDRGAELVAQHPASKLRPHGGQRGRSVPSKKLPKKHGACDVNSRAHSGLPPVSRCTMAPPTAGAILKQLGKLGNVQGDWRP